VDHGATLVHGQRAQWPCAAHVNGTPLNTRR